MHKIDLGDTCSVSDSFDDEEQGQGITEESQYDNDTEEQQKRSILGVDKFTNGIDNELDHNEKKCLSPQSPSEYYDIGDIINQQDMRYKSQDSLTPLSRKIIDKNRRRREGLNLSPHRLKMMSWIIVMSRMTWGLVILQLRRRHPS